MKNFLLIPTKAAQPIPDDLYEEVMRCTFNGPMVESRHDDETAPIPWDAAVGVEEIVMRRGPEGEEVKRMFLALHGSFGPSGYGMVSVHLPLEDNHERYPFDIVLEYEDGTTFPEEIVKAFNQIGWQIIPAPEK